MLRAVCAAATLCQFDLFVVVAERKIELDNVDPVVVKSRKAPPFVGKIGKKMRGWKHYLANQAAKRPRGMRSGRGGLGEPPQFQAPKMPPPPIDYSMPSGETSGSTSREVVMETVSSHGKTHMESTSSAGKTQAHMESTSSAGKTQAARVVSNSIKVPCRSSRKSKKGSLQLQKVEEAVPPEPYNGIPFRDDVTEFPCDSFQKHIVVCTQTSRPKHLGNGGAGSVWLGTDAKTKEQVVIKLFYLKSVRVEMNLTKTKKKWVIYLKGGQHVTSEKARAFLAKKMREARQDCEGSNRAAASPKGIKSYLSTSDVKQGPQRVRRCLGSNIDFAGPEDLLYIKLKDAGENDLKRFQKQIGEDGIWSLDLAAQVIKQLIQGLMAVDRAGLVHHDLKPDNIMVRSGLGGREKTVWLQLIDFGFCQESKPENVCGYRTGFTLAYSPPEHKDGPKVCINSKHELIPGVFDKRNPAGFDAYPAGLIMIEVMFMCSHEKFFTAIGTAMLNQAQPKLPSVGKAKAKEVLRRLDVFIREMRSNSQAFTHWVQEMKENVWIDKQAKFMPAIVYVLRRTEETMTFLLAIAELLRVSPQDRPHIKTILDTTWMRNTQVLDNPDP